MTSNALNIMDEETPEVLIELFETATCISLSNKQCEAAKNIIENLGKNTTVLDFVEQADSVEELKEFSRKIRDLFLNDVKYQDVFNLNTGEEKVRAIDVGLVTQRMNDTFHNSIIDSNKSPEE